MKNVLLAAAVLLVLVGCIVASKAMLGDNPDLAIFTAVVFALLVLLVGSAAWKPLMKLLEGRETHIADEISTAEQRRREAQELLARHEALIAGASGQTQQILNDARQQAETTSQRIVSEARDAIQRDRKRLLTEVEAAKNNALQELASRTADTAVALAGRIVRRELRPDDHTQLITQTLDRFPNRRT